MLPIRLRSRDDFRCNYEYRWPAHKITSNQAFLVYSKPSCVQCSASYRALDSKGIDYQVVDMSQDTDALERVKALGYLQAPVVITDEDHWSGFRPDKIDELAKRAILPFDTT